MAKRNARAKKGAAMNLVSLMDIFTILVFFLLVSQAQTDQLPEDEKLTLPNSIAQTRPETTVTVMITQDRIIVEGQQVATIHSVVQQQDKIVQSVHDALTKELGKVLVKDAEVNTSLREVTILGDKTIPFKVLKKIMNTCVKVGYKKISLAVIQQSAVKQS